MRPNSSSKNISLKKIGRPSLLEFEASNPGIEWLAKNWRRHRISNIEASPYLAILNIFLEDHKFLPSVREIMKGLIQA